MPLVLWFAIGATIVPHWWWLAAYAVMTVALFAWLNERDERRNREMHAVAKFLSESGRAR
jgi:hypothetical protein